ncbi:hypothetical protein VBZ67_07155 [Campylobacter concisus]
MKKFGLFLILALSIFGGEFEGEMKNYDEVFVKIKEQRKGLNSGEISSLQDPFKLKFASCSKRRSKHYKILFCKRVYVKGHFAK